MPQFPPLQVDAEQQPSRVGRGRGPARGELPVRTRPLPEDAHTPEDRRVNRRREEGCPWTPAIERGS